MQPKKSKGFAARLGAMFGKKPEHHVTPHIYISTERDAQKRKAKAKQRAAILRQRSGEVEKAARQAAAAAPAALEKGGETVVRGIGKLQKTRVKPDASASSALDEASLENEEGFMQKVKMQKYDRAPRKGLSLWTMIRDRFVGDTTPIQHASTEKINPIDQAKDSFLQHATALTTEPMIRTEVTDAPGRETLSAPPSSVETSAGRSALDEALASTQGEQEARKAERSKAMEDNKDIVEAQKAEQAAKKPVEKPTKKVHIAQFQSKKGFKAFLTSINYIGMGKERMSFIQNMATMLNAGLPLIDSLKTLVLETHNRSMRKLLGRIIDAVENGSPLWRAMEAQNFFSLHALALVRIGEEAGSLAENMGYLAEQDEKDHALRSKVKMAMIYPTIVMVIMFIIVVGLGMFVLPNLVGVLFSLNVKLPLITRIVIWCSDAFVNYGTVGVPSFIASFFVIAILSKYTSLRVVTQWFLFKIPGIGKLAKEATIARFGVILGGLLKAGVPVIEALESLVQVTPIASYKKLYAQLLARVAIGDSFSKCFASIHGSQKLLPPSVQQLVITGEKSGSLADIMLKIADIYDKKATETAEKLPIILEPMLLLFIGGLVGSIAFAIIIPIYSIVGNVGGA